ncbi:MAG: SIMPL domain-containing protein [Chloroflexi bacterium]|nr:SIMPL domain-containing protein [Chloroflexota bacterium]
MRKKWLAPAGIILLLGVGIFVLAGCVTVSAPPSQGAGQQQGIWVNGEGTVTVVPDIAILRLGIEAQETTVAQAQSRASEAMNRVMNALKGRGVAEKDIQTQRFSIQRVTRFEPRDQREVLVGYRVTNTVTAKIREIDKAGQIIDAVAEAGGDLTRIDGISFSVDKPEAFMEEARGKAMADAKAKAQQLAQLGGVSLGKATYIAESGRFPPPIPLAFAEGRLAAAAPTPISAGEMEITLSVQVVYEIR